MPAFFTDIKKTRVSILARADQSRCVSSSLASCPVTIATLDALCLWVTGIPALRKDFTLDALQVLEARATGADAVLLIVRILEDGPLRELREQAESLGMAALVEVHTSDELGRALDSGARVIGVNNRDLRTFRTDLAVTESLLPHLPEAGILVSESGIRTAADVERLGRAGVHAVLVGESILRAPDPAAQVRALSRHPRAART